MRKRFDLADVTVFTVFALVFGPSCAAGPAPVPGATPAALVAPGAGPFPGAGTPSPLPGGVPFVSLEGPFWVASPTGAHLLFSDVVEANAAGARIYRFDPDSARFSILPYPPSVTGGATSTNGLAVDRSGALLACERYNARLIRLAPGGQLTVLADRGSGRAPGDASAPQLPLNAPNDLAVRRDGNIYFTDSDWGTRPGAEHAGVEFQPHQEHVQHHSQLGDYPQMRRDGGGQNEHRGIRPDAAQHRGPQDNSRHDLTDYRRLANVAEEQPEDSADEQDGCQCDQDVHHRVGSGHRTRGGSSSAPPRPGPRCPGRRWS
jgi:hypothetical protein